MRFSKSKNRNNFFLIQIFFSKSTPVEPCEEYLCQIWTTSEHRKCVNCVPKCTSWHQIIWSPARFRNFKIQLTKFEIYIFTKNTPVDPYKEAVCPKFSLKFNNHTAAVEKCADVTRLRWFGPSLLSFIKYNMLVNMYKNVDQNWIMNENF